MARCGIFQINKIMSVDITVNKPLECVGVHWDSPPLNEAKAQFAEWGFDNIQNFRKERKGSGNDLRTKVVAIAKKQDIKYYYVGDYDATIGDNAAIYRFEYDEYSGSLVDGSGDAKYNAAWSGKA